MSFLSRVAGVMVIALRDGQKLAVTVEDTGICVGENDLPHLGKALFQAGASCDQSRDGAGLGLSIVKGLVRLHGGEVDIQSWSGNAGDSTTAS